MNKLFLFAIVLLLLLPAAGAQFTLSADMSADIDVYFDSLMHANYTIEGYAFSVRAFGISADPRGMSAIMRNTTVRDSSVKMIEEEFMKMKDAAFPALNISLKSAEIDPEPVSIGGRTALKIRMEGDMNMKPGDIGYNINLTRIFNSYDPVEIVSSMINGAEGMKSPQLPTRVPGMSEEEIYAWAMDAGAYADMNFSLVPMQRIGVDYNCSIVLPEHVMLEGTNVRQSREGSRHVIEFDERDAAIRGRIASDMAPHYDGDDVRVEGTAHIDQSVITIDLPEFLRTQWMEAAARGHVRAKAVITVDHFRSPEGIRAIMPRGTGMDYIDADAVRFGYRIGMLTDEDVNSMFEVIVPAIERMYQGLFAGFGSSKVVLSVNVEDFIEQLKADERGPLVIEAEGYLDVPLIAFIRGSPPAGDGSGAPLPGIVRIAQSLINLARTRTVPLSLSMENPLKYWPLDFSVTFGEGLQVNGDNTLNFSVPPGGRERLDIRIWFSLPFVIALATPYSILVFLLAIIALAALALLYLVIKELTGIFKYHLR